MPSSHDGRQVGVDEATLRLVARFLREWEDSDMLYDEAARKLWSIFCEASDPEGPED